MRWLFLLLLIGCTDFDDVTRNTCGNGLLEAGEDCDSSDPSCVRCAVSCAVDEDCPTDAYACGVDGFCHAPNGELARPSPPVTFQADELRIADIDHDGRGDVLGVSRTSLVVRYGDAAGSLSAGDSFVTPAQSGPASFGDLDGDGSIDVTLATTEGLVSYTSAFGSLSPVDIESPIFDGDSGQAVDILAIRTVGPLQFLAFGVSDNIVILFMFDFLDETKSVFAAPCSTRLGAIQRASFDIAKVDLYRINPDAAARNAVLSFTTTTNQVCVMSLTGSTAAGYTLADITPAGIGTLAKKPILADLEGDADPCPALINSDGGPAAMKQWEGQLASGKCSFTAAGPAGAALPVLLNAPANATAIGRVPISPPIPFVSSDALVMTNGLYAQSLGFMAAMYLSSRPLAHVTFGDLDGDGDIDAAAGSPTEDDIDILYRYPEGVELLRFDTASRVTTITIGDYDGNSIGDLAYTETALNHQKMYVAYGTPDRHLPPLQISAFAAVSTVAVFEFRDSADNLSVADDLLVIQPAVGNATATATLLHGSPQRTMLSFLDPRTDEMRAKSVIRGSVVGEFAGTSKADLMVFATPHPQQAIGMRAYRVAGTETGLDTAQGSGTVVDGLADCQLASPNGACVQNAKYLAWPRAGGDVVIAVDGRSAPRAMRIDPGQTAQALPMLVEGLPQGSVVQSLYAFDIDGDDKPELIASFTGSVRICDMTPDGIPTQCEEVRPGSSTMSCIDAAPGRMRERGLVVLCREGTTSTLFQVIRRNASLSATELAQGVSLRALRVGDVTGDGVDDVVAVQGDGSASALVVYPQCTARDAASCSVNTKESK
ncbi:MAG: VCBS repeat-containing protein [Myxococcota bacterium]|nr:VCBS repeat-containing protein [Myxococcota bacterium]